MFRRIAIAVLAAATLTLAGCYHATVNTGAAPSPVERVERNWAHGFLYGLVPPSTTDVGDDCEHGVARVETQLSFANQLANIITFGLYTPMTVVATCAIGEGTR